jgi:hypothetical protein
MNGRLRRKAAGQIIVEIDCAIAVIGEQIHIRRQRISQADNALISEGIARTIDDIAKSRRSHRGVLGVDAG